jgi:predicted nuclease of predicted toxin-antitoxin system
MSRPRFLADHDFNERVLRAIERQEPTIEIVRVREVNLQERPDAEVLAYAATRQLITISHDINTMPAAAYALVAARQAMHGLLLVQQRSAYRPTIESLVLIALASEAEEWISQVRFLPL